MEHRKLIKFGNSSHIVSLPNEWVRKNNLKKGDLIYYSVNDSEIRFCPELKEEKKELKEISIEIDNKTIDNFRREVIAAYIDGYDIVKLIGRDLEENVRNVRNILRNLTSYEIIKQTPNQIVAQDFFNIREVNIKGLIKRMDIITRSMIDDSIEGLMKKEDKYNVLFDKDTDVNRLSFLLFRVIKISLNDSVLANKLDMDNVQLLDNWLLIVNIEKVADEAKRISRFLRKSRLKNDEKEELIELYNKIKNAYLDAMKAYYNGDKKLAKEVLLRQGFLIKECNNYFEKHNKGVLGSVIEKLKGFVMHVKDIARVVYAY